MRALRLLSAALVLATIFACSKKTPVPTPSISPEAQPSPELKGAVARVGDLEITQRDVEAMRQVQSIYDDSVAVVTADRALQELISNFVVVQILKNNGLAIDHDTLLKEREYFEGLETNRKAVPKFKMLFAPDGKLGPELYLRDVILPEYAERVIYHEFFLRDPKIQQEAHEKALSFLAKVKAKPDDFEKIAQASQLKAGVFRATDRMVGTEGPAYEMASPLGGKKVEGALPFLARPEMTDEAYRVRAVKATMDAGRELQLGQVFPEPIETKEGWWVYRLLQKSRKPVFTLRLQGVYFSKADYPSWLEKEKTRVTITKGGS
jgi:hypothetical protein